MKYNYLSLAKQEAANLGENDALYGRPQNNPYPEDSPLAPWYDLGYLEVEDDDFGIMAETNP